jgi:hypothetical protein
MFFCPGYATGFVSCGILLSCSCFIRCGMVFATPRCAAAPGAKVKSPLSRRGSPHLRLLKADWMSRSDTRTQFSPADARLPRDLPNNSAGSRESEPSSYTFPLALRPPIRCRLIREIPKPPSGNIGKISSGRLIASHYIELCRLRSANPKSPRSISALPRLSRPIRNSGAGDSGSLGIGSRSSLPDGAPES